MTEEVKNTLKKVDLVSSKAQATADSAERTARSAKITVDKADGVANKAKEIAQTAKEIVTKNAASIQAVKDKIKNQTIKVNGKNVSLEKGLILSGNGEVVIDTSSEKPGAIKVTLNKDFVNKVDATATKLANLEKAQNETKGFRIHGDNGLENALNTELTAEYGVRIGGKKKNGHQNIYVTADSKNNELAISLDANVKVDESITAGDEHGQHTKIAKDGVTVADNAGSTVIAIKSNQERKVIRNGKATIERHNVIAFKEGPHGEGATGEITGIATPTADQITHVANVDYVNRTVSQGMQQVNHRIDNLSNTVSTMNKDLRAGIAGSTAIGFLQRPNSGGKSMISAALGGYRGQHAVALGFARTSEDNGISFKAGISLNTRNDFNYGTSIGYQW